MTRAGVRAGTRLPRALARRLRSAVRPRKRVVPVVPPATRRRWERADPDDHAAAAHLHYLRHRDAYLPAYFACNGGYPPPRTRLSRGWRWYVSDVLVQSLRLARAHGPAVRHRAGVPVRRQLAQMLRLSATLPSVPANYYLYELYRPEHRARTDAYLHRHETKGVLYALLATVDDPEAAAPLNDKAAFADHARAAGLAVVPTVAVLSPGGDSTGGTVAAQPAPVPAADLVVKPHVGKGGHAVAKWRYDADGDTFHQVAGPGAGAGPDAVPRGELLTALARRAPDSTHLVQPCLANHPDIAELALDAVATCRLVTILDEHDEPEPVLAIFRMPAAHGAVVDNMHRGGLAAPVDAATGTLGPAAGYADPEGAERLTTHPATGARLAGRVLPHWPAVRELACAAHRAFAPRVLVGWDICLAPDGPVLVEGNEQPGVDGLQRLHRQPLGDHRFGALLHHHLTRHDRQGVRA